MKLVKSLLVLTLLVLASSVHATLIKESTTFYNRGGSYEMEDYHFGTRRHAVGDSKTHSRYIAINSFDSSLGTLNSVDIRLSSSYQLQSQVKATDVWQSSDGWESVKGEGISGMKLEAYLTDSLGTTIYDRYYIYNVVKSSCSLNSQTTNTCSGSNKKLLGFQVSFDLSSIDMSLFLDNNFKVKLVDTRSIKADTRDSDSQVYSYNKNSWWYGHIETYYNYTEAPIASAEVPEPSSFAILGLGLLGLGLTRKKVSYQSF